MVTLFTTKIFQKIRNSIFKALISSTIYWSTQHSFWQSKFQLLRSIFFAVFLLWQNFVNLIISLRNPALSSSNGWPIYNAEVYPILDGWFMTSARRDAKKKAFINWTD